jgi:hypothetical protein
MKRMSSLLVVLVLAVAVCLIASVVPVAQAQTFHFVGAGSPAQFLMAAIGADQAAVNANATLYNGANHIYHWTFALNGVNGAYLSDSRNGSIVNQYGSVWVVWIESGAYPGTVTDVWLDVSVESAIGVRCALAQQVNGSGCQVQLNGIAAGNAGSQLVAGNLWPDGLNNGNDTNMDQPLLNAINTGVSGGQHVSVALTDIRAEDALYAVTRALTALNTTTWAGLGYALGTANTGKLIGYNIYSGQPATPSAYAQPVSFALPGTKDPFNTTLIVPTTFVTLPIGAAPIVFITNNNSTPSIFNLVSGVTPGLNVKNSQVYPLAKLFDGTTSCDTHNVAFGGNGDGLGTPLTVFLQDPLSGTMNTTEFNLFRSFGNTNDTQEKGFGINPQTGGTIVSISCPYVTGQPFGLRSRAIGTTEVIGTTGNGGLLNTPNSFGYIFPSWGNLAKLKAGANFNYMTLDGLDPIFASPTAYSVCTGGSSGNGQVCGANEPCPGDGTCTGMPTGQLVPYCAAPVCSSDLWPAYTDPSTGFTYLKNATYPNLRYGLYKAWSVYRWITTNTSDPYGPSKVASEAQNYVDQDVADFVPFSTCLPGEGSSCATPDDGLAVFRSHFAPRGVTLNCGFGKVLSNGAVSNQNSFDGGNTRGGGNANTGSPTGECGGDVGGLVYGPFGTNSPSVSYVIIAAKATAGKGYKVTYKNGDQFGGLAVGNPISVTCTNAGGAEATTATTVQTLSNATTVYLSSLTAIANNTGTIACLLVDPNILHAPANATSGNTTEHQVTTSQRSDTDGERQ